MEFLISILLTTQFSPGYIVNYFGSAVSNPATKVGVALVILSLFFGYVPLLDEIINRFLNYVFNYRKIRFYIIFLIFSIIFIALRIPLIILFIFYGIFIILSRHFESKTMTPGDLDWNSLE